MSRHELEEMFAFLSNEQEVMDVIEPDVVFTEETRSKPSLDEDNPELNKKIAKFIDFTHSDIDTAKYFLEVNIVSV